VRSLARRFVPTRSSAGRPAGRSIPDGLARVVGGALGPSPAALRPPRTIVAIASSTADRAPLAEQSSARPAATTSAGFVVAPAHCPTSSRARSQSGSTSAGLVKTSRQRRRPGRAGHGVRGVRPQVYGAGAVRLRAQARRDACRTGRPLRAPAPTGCSTAWPPRGPVHPGHPNGNGVTTGSTGPRRSRAGRRDRHRGVAGDRGRQRMPAPAVRARRGQRGPALPAIRRTWRRCEGRRQAGGQMR